MLYMPASTLATPVVLQEAQPVVPAARYVMLQPAATAVVPTVPLLSAAFVYPKYTVAAKTNEKENTDKSQGIRSNTQTYKFFNHSFSDTICSTCHSSSYMFGENMSWLL